MIIYFVLPFCLFLGVLSSIVIHILGGHYDTLFFKSTLIKGIFLFFIINISAICLFKSLTGEAGESLWSCIREFNVATCFHYGIPLVVGAVVSPFILFFVLKNRIKVFFDSFIYIWILLFAVVVSLLGNPAVLLLTIINGVSLLISLARTYCRNEFEIDFIYVNKSLKGIFQEIFSGRLVVVLFYGITILFLVPCQVLLHNLAEIPVRYTYVIGGACVSLLLAILIWGCLLIITPKSDASWALVLLFAGTLMSYLQVNFLNGKMALLDGDMQVWNQLDYYSNLAIWTVGICVILGIYICNKKALNVYMLISGFFSLTQVVAIAALLLTTDYSLQEKDGALLCEGINVVHEKDNVIVFVLDWYDEQLVEMISEQDEEFFSPLKDFTFYDNTTSKYAFTYMSVPYLLSAREWQEGQTELDYIASVNQESDFLRRIKENGYVTTVLTEATIIDDKLGAFIDNYSEHVNGKTRYDMWKVMEIIARSGRYSSMPYILKYRYRYTANDMVAAVLSEDVYTMKNDICLYNYINENQFEVNHDANGYFLFAHLIGAHGPCHVNEDMMYDEKNVVPRISQSKAAMKVVYSYIDKLKSAGLYDDATIIITADHGQNYFNRPELMEEEGFRVTSSPVLFVKMPGDNNEVMAVSHVPMSHEDFVATVLKAVGDSNYDDYGMSFDEVIDEYGQEKSSIRVRRMIFGRTGDVPFVTYEINGDVRVESSWTVVD